METSRDSQTPKSRPRWPGAWQELGLFAILAVAAITIACIV